MLDRLVVERKKFEKPEGVGNMRPLIDQYVKENTSRHKEKAWPSYGNYAGTAFRNANVEDIKPFHVNTWLKKKYDGKLAMQRVMRAFLSGFFQWAIDSGKIERNPCKEVKISKPKARSVYISDSSMVAIRTAMLLDSRGSLIPSGKMIQCFVDLCYLTAQRSTEIRNLKWKQIDGDVIHFVPSKTEDSSGIAVDFRITPEIRAVLDRVRAIDGHERIGECFVIHQKNGDAYGATGVRSAWDRAVERAGLSEMGYTVKDIRAKALTDAKKAGYDLKALMEAAAHSNPGMTERYIKQRTVPVSDVRLHMPTGSDK